MPTLTPNPSFVERDPAQIAADLVTEYESLTGRALYPAQLERLLIDVIAYRESLVRMGIQNAAEQCLVQFARGVNLEALGALVGVSRLQPSRAVVMLRLAISVASGSDTPFAAGWGAIGPGKQVFRLSSSAVIPAGLFYVDVLATADAASGVANNIPAGGGWAALIGFTTVSSVTISSGGADLEDDEGLRRRILAAPARFSCAGSLDGYRFHALSASPEIRDVSVDSPYPGVVGVYVLAQNGLPSQATLDLVQAALNSDAVRPLCDLVRVQAPVRVPWNIDVTLTLFRRTDAAMVLAAVQSAIESYAMDRSAGLGRDIVGSQIIAALSVAGVYKVVLNGWSDITLAANQWANIGSIQLHVAIERADG